MDRCWLQGAVGDALHALCCAAGYNIRWLLRAIARRGLGALFCAVCAVVASVACLLGASPPSRTMAGAGSRPLQHRRRAFTSLEIAAVR
jgi:IS5 family transposase